MRSLLPSSLSLLLFFPGCAAKDVASPKIFDLKDISTRLEKVEFTAEANVDDISAIKAEAEIHAKDVSLAKAEVESLVKSQVELKSNIDAVNSKAASWFWVDFSNGGGGKASAVLSGVAGLITALAAWKGGRLGLRKWREDRELRNRGRAGHPQLDRRKARDG